MALFSLCALGGIGAALNGETTTRSIDGRSTFPHSPAIRECRAHRPLLVARGPSCPASCVLSSPLSTRAGCGTLCTAVVRFFLMPIPAIFENRPARLSFFLAALFCCWPRRQAHQQASERRPPIKGPTPVAPPPPEVRERETGVGLPGWSVRHVWVCAGVSFVSWSGLRTGADVF